MTYTLHADTDPSGLRVVASDGSVVAYAAPQHASTQTPAQFDPNPWVVTICEHTREGSRILAAQRQATIIFASGGLARDYMCAVRLRCEEMERVKALADAWNAHTGFYASSDLDDTRTSFYTRTGRVATWDFSPLLRARLQLAGDDFGHGTLDDLARYLARWTGGTP